MSSRFPPPRPLLLKHIGFIQRDQWIPWCKAENPAAIPPTLVFGDDICPDCLKLVEEWA